MPNDHASPSPTGDDASSSPPDGDRRGDPAFLGRPDAGESPAEFTRRVLEALLGKDDPRVKNWQPTSGAESKEKQ